MSLEQSSELLFFQSALTTSVIFGRIGEALKVYAFSKIVQNPTIF